MPPKPRPERESPPFILRPLSPRPHQQHPRFQPSLPYDADIAPSSSRTYPGALEKPFPNPHEALCHSYNVCEYRLEIRPGHALPELINMPVLRDAHMPTHVLAITDAPVLPRLQPSLVSIHPILAPINAELFATKFSNDVAQLSSHYTTPGSLMPVPYWDRSTRSQAVTLPLIPLIAPHPASLPLLIFYGMGLHHSYDPIPLQLPPSPGSPLPDDTQFRPPRRRRSNDTNTLAGSSTGLLATYLLPTAVIEEYPAADLMASKMCEICTNAELEAYAAYNRGFWRNVLSLAPVDTDIIDIARIAWNVTKEATWTRSRMHEFQNRGRQPSVMSLNPPSSAT